MEDASLGQLEQPWTVGQEKEEENCISKVDARTYARPEVKTRGTATNGEKKSRGGKVAKWK